MPTQSFYHAGSLHKRGLDAIGAGRLRDALTFFHEALSLEPASIRLLIDGSRVAQVLGEHEQTITLVKRGLRLAPREPNLRFLLAESLRHIGSIRRSLELLRELERDCPQMPGLAQSLATCYLRLGRYADSERYFRAALADPQGNHVQTQWEYSQLLLQLGRFFEAWPGYQLRFAPTAYAHVHRHDFGVPYWQGENLRGKRILVHPEQGLGDQIMFASLLPLLQAEGADIVLACGYELVDLFCDAFPTIPVFGMSYIEDAASWLSGVAPFDFQTPIAELAVYRCPHPNSWKAQPYLRANAARRERMQRYLTGVAPGWDNRKRYPLRVGVMWAAGPGAFDPRARSRSERKSISPPLLNALAQCENTLFISLQPRQSADGAAYADELDLIDCSETLATMADTAAVIDLVDIVLTVDTSVAHLAGGMGKATYTALPFDADWRWLVARRDSIWYSNMTLIRQPKPGDWKSVVAQLCVAVRRHRQTENIIPTVTMEGRAP